MTPDQLRALPVGQLAADDAALLLWATWPTLPQALDLIEAWGFAYKTLGFCWVKQSGGDGLFVGMGYWTRANTEPVLLATRGAPSRLSGATDVRQVVMAPVAAHSAKPEQIQDRIERLVAGPYLELFARRVRPGWTCWGDEIPKSDRDLGLPPGGARDQEDAVGPDFDPETGEVLDDRDGEDLIATAPGFLKQDGSGGLKPGD